MGIFKKVGKGKLIVGWMGIEKSGEGQVNSGRDGN